MLGKFLRMMFVTTPHSWNGSFFNFLFTWNLLAILLELISYCVVVCIQSSGHSPLWEEQSSSDSSFTRLRPCSPAIPGPPASLAGLAAGRQGGFRSLCLPGTCLSFLSLYIHVCAVWTQSGLRLIKTTRMLFELCDYRYCRYAAEDGRWSRLAPDWLKLCNR